MANAAVRTSAFGLMTAGPATRRSTTRSRTWRAKGLATFDDKRPYRIYGLTEEGFAKGARALTGLPERGRGYMADASRWIFSFDVRDLLAAIYEYAPDMAGPSVLPRARLPVRREGPLSAFLGGVADAFYWTPESAGSEHSRSAAEGVGAAWAAVGDYLQAAMGRERVERIAPR